MSANGWKRTSRQASSTSGFPPKADIAEPKPDYAKDRVRLPYDYTRLIFERAIKDQLELMADPGAYRRWRDADLGTRRDED